MTRDNEPADLILSRLSAHGGQCVRLAQIDDGVFRVPAEQDGSFWLPRPLPPGRSVHVASSRLGRTPESFPAWFDALRTFAAAVDRQTTFLLTAAGTTTDPFVRRIGQLYRIPVVQVALLPAKLSDNWIQDQLNDPTSVATIWFCKSPDNKATSVDQWLIGIAKEVRVLRVTANGTIQHCVTARLTKQPNGNAERTWLLIDQELSKPKITQDLLAAGATAWWLYEPAPATTTASDGPPLPAKPVAAAKPIAASVLSIADINPADYALHCTRRRAGRWPDQNETDFLDDLIFRQPGSDHRQLASLCRILTTERLIATHALTRSTTPVVCFSDVPLDQLAAHRTFRKHLSRWDFEPYGIAFRREVLKAQGAAPVIYGDEATWESLPSADQPFFQPATSKDGQTDWRNEREWRICGDLSLNRITTSDAIVFVATRAEAKTVAAISKWPVVVLE